MRARQRGSAEPGEGEAARERGAWCGRGGAPAVPKNASRAGHFCYNSPCLRVGTWRSLVARLLWEQDVAGSNPVVPTMNLGCEPCRAITFGRARLSLTKKLTENKELSADLQVTNRCHLVCAETTKAPGPWSKPQVVGQ